MLFLRLAARQRQRVWEIISYSSVDGYLQADTWAAISGVDEGVLIKVSHIPLGLRCTPSIITPHNGGRTEGGAPDDNHHGVGASQRLGGGRGRYREGEGWGGGEMGKGREMREG